MTFNWTNTSIHQLDSLLALAFLCLAVSAHVGEEIRLPVDLAFPYEVVLLPAYPTLFVFALCNGFPVYTLIGSVILTALIGYVPKWLIKGLAALPWPTRDRGAIAVAVRGYAVTLMMAIGVIAATAFAVKFRDPFPVRTQDPADALAARAALFRGGGYWVPVDEAGNEPAECQAIAESIHSRVSFYHFSEGHMAFHLLAGNRSAVGSSSAREEEQDDVATNFQLIGNQIDMHQRLLQFTLGVHAVYDRTADRITDLDGYTCENCAEGQAGVLKKLLGLMDLDTAGRLYRFCSGELAASRVRTQRSPS